MLKTDVIKSQLAKLIQNLATSKNLNEKQLSKLLNSYSRNNQGTISKGQLLSILKINTKVLKLSKAQEEHVKNLLKMKKVRTQSGVTPVTVLTMPYPCPGKCIFCPNDIKMPKSYLSSEPGAQRALANSFDPYLQTLNRLNAYYNIGHPTDKIELIILGGTWSSYPKTYQLWFIKRCFDALNDFSTTKSIKYMVNPAKTKKIITAKIAQFKTNSYNDKVINLTQKKFDGACTLLDLKQSHFTNESSKTRCVGLVVETRPDCVSFNELVFLRKLGVTKVQIGIQSLSDNVLSKNKRGHTVKDILFSINLLRQFGFKIQLHWMPNLYGSSVKNDKRDFKRIFSKKYALNPDELKIYPCSLINGTELINIYKKKLWFPYSENELLEVLVDNYKNTPRYCRITRMVRDISSDDIVVGNKKTNFRQLVEAELSRTNTHINEIRYREIRDVKVNLDNLPLVTTKYNTKVSEEMFIEYVTATDKLAGFLRLSIPKVKQALPELSNEPIIREVHIYGGSLELGQKSKGNAQHLGLGKSLISEAITHAKKLGYRKIAVISAIGTKEYYKRLGFYEIDLYLHKII